MSEWIRATRELKKETKDLEKLIKGYSYQKRDRAERTDHKVRKVLAEDMEKSKEVVFNAMEDLYKDSDIDRVEKLKEVIEWMDVFTLELTVELVYDEDATSNEFGKLIRYDLSILKDSAKLAGTLSGMQKSAGSLVKKAGTIKKYVVGLLQLYKGRRHALEV